MENLSITLLFYIILIIFILGMIIQFIRTAPWGEDELFVYTTPHKRVCKLCGSSQGWFGLSKDVGWWVLLKPHESRPNHQGDCACHKFHKTKE